MLALFILFLSLYNKHALSVLLSLEFIVLIMCVLLLNVDMFLVLLLLCVGACGGAMGLGSLVKNIRLYSLNVYVTSFYNGGLFRITHQTAFHIVNSSLPTHLPRLLLRRLLLKVYSFCVLPRVHRGTHDSCDMLRYAHPYAKIHSPWLYSIARNMLNPILPFIVRQLSSYAM